MFITLQSTEQKFLLNKEEIVIVMESDKGVGWYDIKTTTGDVLTIKFLGGGHAEVKTLPRVHKFLNKED